MKKQVVVASAPAVGNPVLVAVRISLALHEELRRQCVTERRDLSDMLRLLIADGLKIHQAALQ